jgi:flagellar biosynthesis/type III secretory pathway M-ring protein FliF/YscJ
MSEPAAISVTTALSSDPAAQSPRPIKELLPVGFAYKRQVLWACGVLVVILAALFIWRLIMRNRKTRFTVHTIPPHEAALSALAELEGDESLDGKDFAFRLSAICRTYMESLRGMPAAEMTYEEIAAAIKDPEDREVLPVLKATDLVKFAEQEPTIKDREEQTAKIRAYVNCTRPMPENAEKSSKPVEGSR